MGGVARGYETRPIDCVNWWESYAFCIWDGGFLPSEAEWGYAAGGGSQEREFPWGSTDPGIDNQYAIYGAYDTNCYYPSLGICMGVISMAPVGTPTLGAGRWGQMDLVGEVIEWNLDWFAPYVVPSVDGASLTPTSGRAFRGSYFNDPFERLILPPPYADLPTTRNFGLGFRCARTP